MTGRIKMKSFTENARFWDRLQGKSVAIRSA
jgi:hypothetical protein